jgi:tellurite resistance protein TerC
MSAKNSAGLLPVLGALRRVVRPTISYMDVPIWTWFAFAAFVVAMLAVDLLMHRRAHVIAFREAACWSAVWVSLGLTFALVVWWAFGGSAAASYTGAYLIEKSLSVDNLFVFALIFAYFRVPAAYQHRVLFCGVIGALIMRAVLLAAGVQMLHAFHWLIYGFGAFLVWTAVKMLRNSGEVGVDPGRSRPVRLLKRIIAVSDRYEGQRFLIRRGGVLMATPLLAVNVAVEAADLVFAVDSIPAVLAISDELFIVYTSNAFAILGLRALYFMLSGMLGRFHYLNVGLAVVLAFVGVKMLISDLYQVPVWASLAVIALVLTTAIVASLRRPVPAGDGGTGEGATDKVAAMP